MDPKAQLKAPYFMNFTSTRRNLIFLSKRNGKSFIYIATTINAVMVVCVIFVM